MSKGAGLKKYLVLAVCGLLLSGNVAAQTSAEQKERHERTMAISVRAHQLLMEAETRAMEQCNTTRLVVLLPDYSFSSKAEITTEGVVSVEWSGGCVEGKRDGAGELSWQTERSIGGSAIKLTVMRTAEGRFVKGRRLGMWCVTKFQSELSNGKSPPQAPFNGLGCALVAGAEYVTPHYIKQPDGRWQEYVMGAPGASSLAAGELEAKSAKLLSDAAADKTEMTAQVVMQSRDLEELVRGSKIVVALSAAPISLKDKRVAIVISSQTSNEFERVKRERQALIDASAGLRGEAAAQRAKFIQASDPNRLLINILKVVKKHAKDARPADDLAVLQGGGFDYALVVDWKSHTRFDQLGKYSKEAWPAKPFPAISGVACESLRGFLINRDLKVVKQLPAFPTCQVDQSNATGDQAYMWILATYFADGWGNGPDELGNKILGLDAFLKFK